MLETVKILIILTSQATMGAGGAPTGVWLEELSTPYYAFINAGMDVELASISGGKIPVDPYSLQIAGKNPASVERFLKDSKAMQQFKHSQKIETIDIGRYAAIFLPGGRGTMWDMPDNATLAQLVGNAWMQGKIVAAVCHGPAGLLGAKNSAGLPIIAGKHVSAFTDAEEKATGFTSEVPFALEARLRTLGAKFEAGPNFQAYAVRDGKLVTGQNPASSAEVARLTLEALRVSK